MNGGETALEIDEVFQLAAELFGSDVQQRRDAAFLFLRDVWQVNRLWRAFHDPDNPQQEVLGVAQLLGVHRNTITGKMRALGLSSDTFRRAESVADLIVESETLRVAQQSLIEMTREERNQLEPRVTVR